MTTKKTTLLTAFVLTTTFASPVSTKAQVIINELMQSNIDCVMDDINEFPDYTAEELLKITRITVENKGYALSPDCDAPLAAYFDRRQKADARTAGNGRRARNLVEDAILNQSRRLTAGDVSALTKETLETLLPEDFELE